MGKSRSLGGFMLMWLVALLKEYKICTWTKLGSCVCSALTVQCFEGNWDLRIRTTVSWQHCTSALLVLCKVFRQWGHNVYRERRQQVTDVCLGSYVFPQKFASWLQNCFPSEMCILSVNNFILCAALYWIKSYRYIKLQDSKSISDN